VRSIPFHLGQAASLNVARAVPTQETHHSMRSAIIAGLMAVGMLAGCGGTTTDGNGEVHIACADGTMCTGSADECAMKCGESDGTKHAQMAPHSQLSSTA
jgi:hypothetical protein